MASLHRTILRCRHRGQPYVNSGGTLDLPANAAVPIGFTISAGGTLRIEAGYVISGYVVSSGLTLQIENGRGATSAIVVQSGGVLELQGGAATNGFTVSSGGILQIDYVSGR
jgi:autotransporter passenger strand-loop-strand repeat protein